MGDRWPGDRSRDRLRAHARRASGHLSSPLIVQKAYGNIREKKIKQRIISNSELSQTASVFDQVNMVNVTRLYVSK